MPLGFSIHTSEIGITDGAVRKIIRSLKQQGVVEHVGSNKSGHW